MKVVPDDGELIVVAFVSNEDIGFVEAGLDADVRVASFPFTIYGSLKGVLGHIATDATRLGDVRLGESSIATLSRSAAVDGVVSQDAAVRLRYRTIVELHSTTLHADGKSYVVQPGMAAEVGIVMGRRRIIEFLLDPILRKVGDAFRER